MTGTRRDATTDDAGQYPYPRMNPGEYGKNLDGIWHCCPPQPTGDPWDYWYGNLGKHVVTEHEDGTVTVSPSILIGKHDENGLKEWHGYLERGVWRVC